MSLRLNPVTDYRMPTLIGKAAFGMAPDTSTGMHRSRGLVQLQAAPPRNIGHVRKMMRNEIKALTKRLYKLERLYYGGRNTIHDEIETYIRPIKSVMRAVLIFDLNKSLNVDEIFIRAGKPKQYRPNKSDLVALKEVYLKIQTFLPHKLTDTLESCEKLLDNLNKYCISFYDKKSDGYLGSAANFEIQIEKWRDEISNHIESARTVFMRFRGNDKISLDTSYLCPPVRQFAESVDCCNVLFLVLFADAVSNIRGALLLMTSWMKADENYGSYVKSDAKELEKVRERKTCDLRESKDRFHALTFKLCLAEADLSKLTYESRNVEARLGPLKEQELQLIVKIRELDIETEFKEKKIAQIRKEHSGSDSLPEYFDFMMSDLKDAKDKLPILQRQLSGIQYKIQWLGNKKSARDKANKDVEKLKKALKGAEENKNSSIKQYEETRQSVHVARRIALCKNTNDSAEKLYYSLPFGPKSDRDKGPINSGRPMDRICQIISDNIERDWIQLYRNIPFIPIRGSQTIERDISKINESRERDEILAQQALKRWQRYHTRSKVEDLQTGLKKIRRFDVLRLVNAELAIPNNRISESDLEDKNTTRDPELIPFLKQVELFDKLRAAGRL